MTWWEFFKAIARALAGVPALPPEPEPQVPTPVPQPLPVIPAGLLWGTKEQIRHSIRLICDEMGMTVEQKNTMAATIYGESELNTHAVNYNRNVRGEIISTDRGLCQWNDVYHGSEITPDEAFHNPEKAVRLMGQYWLRGQRDVWIAYKTYRYKQFIDLMRNPIAE